MSQQLIRYGIVGCGSMGREHIENIRARGCTNVTAIADPHPQSRSLARDLLEMPPDGHRAARAAAWSR